MLEGQSTNNNTSVIVQNFSQRNFTGLNVISMATSFILAQQDNNRLWLIRLLWLSQNFTWIQIANTEM